MTQVAPIDPRETERLAAVRRYAILDTPPDDVFDRITSLAARRFNVPISIISIVDEDRIWFKSCHGLDFPQIRREEGLCSSAILASAPYIFSTSVGALDSQLVAGEATYCFYAGVPLTTRDGHNLGTLCIIDRTARLMDEAELDELEDLAALVMGQIEVQLSCRQALARAELMAKEVDHRVMNSLQFVSGLLNMQARSVGAGEIADHLHVAANRVAAVAQSHRYFYNDDPVATSCLGFLSQLCADLGDRLGRVVRVSGSEGDLPSNLIQPLGLLVNELVTNAAKHGGGLINVVYETAGSQSVLIVCDSGKGLPAGFVLSAPGQGLGMQVVKSLAAQLKGVLSAGAGPKGGAFFKLTFPTGHSGAGAH